MGEPITVVAKPSSNPGVVRYETNRALTGMGHERYQSLDDVIKDRPVDVLARRILAHGGVDSVHANGNMITVRLSGGSTGEGLQEIIEDLYIFYPLDDEATVEGEDQPGDEAVVEPTVEPTEDQTTSAG